MEILIIIKYFSFTYSFFKFIISLYIKNSNKTMIKQKKKYKK